MVVLDSNGALVSQSGTNSSNSRSQMPNMPFHHLQYVQPLPSDVSLIIFLYYLTSNNCMYSNITTITLENFELHF